MVWGGFLELEILNFHVLGSKAVNFNFCFLKWQITVLQLNKKRVYISHFRPFFSESRVIIAGNKVRIMRYKVNQIIKIIKFISHNSDLSFQNHELLIVGNKVRIVRYKVTIARKKSELRYKVTIARKKARIVRYKVTTARKKSEL